MTQNRPHPDDAGVADAGVGVVAQEVGVVEAVYVDSRPLPLDKIPL